MPITRIYRYGLLEPFLGAELVAEQMSLAHRYQNSLIELERGRRERVRAIMLGAPSLEEAQAIVDRAVKDLLDARQKIKDVRKAAQRRAETEADRASVSEIVVRLREARRVLKETRAAVRADSAIALSIAGVNDEIAEEQKRRRAACGVYWGSYLLVEQAMDAARKAIVDPRFRRWDGSGRIAVQLQGGLSWADACAGDTRLRVDLAPRAVGKGKPRPTVSLRVGSNGRDPVWASWPIILHRPVPEDATIMWAAVHRTILGGKARWHLLLTLRLPDDFVVEKGGKGTVAVDLGWRQRENGLRVGYMRDDAGDAGEILLEPAIVDGFKKVDDLRSIRDKRIDVMRPRLAEWLRERELPDWLAAERATMHLWKSAARFSRLAEIWRGKRWDGDVEGFDLLWAWRAKDRHLWLWEANLRDKVLARRLDRYRVLGAELARKYHTLVLEDFDLRNLQRHAKPESETVEIGPVRGRQRIAAPSLLRQKLVDAFVARGGRVVEVPSANTTRSCHACGLVEAWDPVTNLMHACTGCGALWDQDDNACRNLLLRERLGADEASEAARPTETEPKTSKWGRLGRHKKRPLASGNANE